MAEVNETGKKNIVLVPAVPDDYEDFFAIRCGESDVFWNGYEGPPEKNMMRDIFMARLGDHALEQNGDKRIYMIKADGRNVGYIGMTYSDEGIEFGYSVLDPERGKGYGSEGMKQAVKLAKQYSDHCFAHIRDDNIASQKAMAKAGLFPTEDVAPRYFLNTGWVGFRKYEYVDQ